MSEAKWSITEAKCLQISHNKYASQRDAISHSMGNLMLSHSAGMHNTDISIAGISKRFHFASLHYIFSAYLPTHIKFLTEFHCIFFGTTCISFPMQKPSFSPFCAKNMRHLRHISIIISVRYNFTDRKNRPFGLQCLYKTITMLCALLPTWRLTVQIFLILLKTISIKLMVSISSAFSF